MWHKGLIYKLERARIKGNLIKWFKTYLSDREQRVVLAGTYSDWTKISAGVPQGSILGPLLFLVYINDIVNDISSTIKLFADDTSLYIVINDPVQDAETLNYDLHVISTWAKTWLVTFNPNKTESLLISRKNMKPNHPPLSMNNVVISEVENHKHLGLNLNTLGTWHNHIEDISKKAWKRINMLRNLKFVLDRISLQKIYFTFIRPIFEYADIIWNNCTEAASEKLEKNSNRSSKNCNWGD